jgi:hypothetical protein
LSARASAILGLFLFASGSLYAQGVIPPKASVADFVGTLPSANGGTDVTSAADDTVLVGGGSAFQLKTLTTCTGSGKAVTYDASSNTFGCNTITGGASISASGSELLYRVSGSEAGGIAGSGVPDGSAIRLADGDVTAPAYRVTTESLGLYGYLPSGSNRSFGLAANMLWTPAPNTTATIALGSVGTVTNGAHEFYLGYEDQSGNRTNAFLIGSIEVTDNKEVDISDIQIGIASVDSWILYVTKAGETGPENAHEYASGTVATSTNLTDSDASLTGDPPPTTNQSIVPGLFLSGSEWGIGDWDEGVLPYIHSQARVGDSTFIDITTPGGHVNISADAGLDIFSPTLTFLGVTTGEMILTGTVTATDFIVSGSRFKSDTVDGHTAGFAAHDVDDNADRDVLVCTNGNAVACTLGTPTGGSLNVLTDMLKIAPGVVGSLGTCDAGATGQVKFVTDALLPASLAIVAAGGAVKVPVFCNGANWIVF